MTQESDRHDFTIRADDLTHPQVLALLREHVDYALTHTPCNKAHVLDLDGLRVEDITIWSAWHGDELAGFGGLRELGAKHAEIKSMRTAKTFLRRGVARALVQHMIQVSRRRGYERISLETAGIDAFAPARAMYERCGFKPCPAFGSYVENEVSVFMTLALGDPQR